MKSPTQYFDEEQVHKLFYLIFLANSIEMFKPCHFEIDDPMHCHWLLKPAVFKWIVYPMKNVRPDSVVDYLPQYDHTLAPHTGGYIYANFFINNNQFDLS